MMLLGVAAFTVPASGQRGGEAVRLPEGSGKQLVESACAKCHGLNLIVSSWGNTKQGWHELIGTMVALPRDQADAVTTYLAANFPEKPAPAAVVVKGPVEVTIREWLVPTLGSRPRDPLSARDGSFWWAAMYGHRLGRLDLKTGDMKEFPLPEGAGPHGLVDDRAGNVWYTGMMRNAVGVLDPKTGSVKEYPVPEGYRGPHTPVIDPKGMVWFTVQSGAVGRINPQTGEMKLAKPPSSPTYPYGIQVNSTGSSGMSTSAATGSPASIPTRWRSRNTPCPRPRRGRAALPSRRTTRFGTRTIRAATSAASIRPRDRSRNGRRQAARSRSPTASPRPAM
jgi:virginiamycin B lyase